VNTHVRSALLALCALASAPLLAAHGGQYRGPGDTVPPGGGGGSGGGAAPGPSGPASPAPGGATSPGPAGPPSPGGLGSPGAEAVSGLGGASAPLTEWTFWWEFNKEPYLELKSHIHAGGTRSGTDDWFLGHGERRESKGSLAPTRTQIRDSIVPALIEALDEETDNDVVTGCLIALAKIGDAEGEDGSSRFEGILAKHLSSKTQEISETAAVALGILANDASVGTLTELLSDSPTGRSLVGSGEVSFRTRSFAAYGLGLIGARTESEEVRQRITRTLVRRIETDDTSSRDLQVACLIALGQVPLETIEPATPPTPSEKGEQQVIDPSSCRIGQLEYVLAFLRDDENRYLVRAHAPTALVRLLQGLEPERFEPYKTTVAEDLLERIRARSKEPREVVQSCVLALGLLGDLDDDPLDARIRKALEDVPKDQSDQLARHFAQIGLGEVGGRLGSGRGVDDGLAQVVKALSGQLVRGRGELPAWAALGIGVLGNELARGSRTPPARVELVRAVRSRLADERSPKALGAYAIASGMLRDVEASPILLDKLARTSDVEARGYVAVALGLMQDVSATDAILGIVRESRYKPELLKQAAIALGLLGDERIVPELLAQLEASNSLGAQAAVASALGFIGDQRSVDPLIAMLRDPEITPRARGFAAVALGIVADKEDLPWNSKIAVDLNYTAATETLNDTAGTGILNIL